MVTLSFVLPAYKRQYLAEAIRSILSQTYSEFELVVVDDCSPENLGEIVASFKDPRVRYVKNEQNLGGKSLIAAWNKAMEYAQGEWCVLASDDDVYMPEYAEKIMALQARYPLCEVLHCRTAIVNGEGVMTKVAEKRPEFESCADLLYARGVKRCLQTAPEFMFKREALKRIGGFVDLPLAWYSDDATWLSLAKDHGIAYCSDVLFHWRYSGSNISSRFDITAGKIAAAERYKKWIAEFVKTVRPESMDDGIVLRLAGPLLYGMVDQQSLYDLGDTKLMPWLSIMLKEPIPLGLKLRSVRNRILSLCSH